MHYPWNSALRVPVVAAALQFGRAGATCALRFAGYTNISELPTFTVPPAEPFSLGDWVFDGAIVHLAGNYTEEAVNCTGDSWRYQTADGDWKTEVAFPDPDSNSSVVFDGFFNVVAGEITVSSIPPSIAPAISDSLYGRTIQLDLTCDQVDALEAEDSCVLFEVNFTNYSPVLDPNLALYRFHDPAVPGLVLPSAQPLSPGDIQLNEGNPIVQRDGTEVDYGCNGDEAEYLAENGEWYHWFTGSNGQMYNLSHVFYATEQDHVNIATIQEVWSPNLEAALYNRVVRLLIHCANQVNYEEGYLLFRVGSTAFDETCENFPGLCVTDVQKTSGAIKKYEFGIGSSSWISVVEALLAAGVVSYFACEWLTLVL